MSLRDLYYKVEDGYFKFLDFLEKKGINLYKIVDPLEKKGIPTFVLFSVILLGIITLILVSIFNTGSSIDENQLTLSFFDETQDPISNKELSFKLNELEYTQQTNDKGVVIIKDLDPSATYSFSLNDSKYSLNVETKDISLSEKNNYAFYLNENKSNLTKKIIFKTNTNELITEDLYASFNCSDNVEFATSELLVENGEIVLENIPSNCGNLIPYISNYEFDSTNDLEANEIDGEIFLSDVEYNVGSLLVSVTDFESGVGLENISISLVNTNLQQVDSSQTNTNGQFVFENIPVGNYLVLLNDDSGIYEPVISQDYDDDIYEVINITENSRTNSSFNLRKDIIGFINLKISDISTNEFLENVEVKLFKNSTLVFSNFTNVDGIVSFALKENVPYKVVIDHKDYIIKNKTLSVVNSQTDFEEIKLQRIDQDTQNGVFVSVIDKDKYPIEYATLKVWNSQENTVVKTITCDIRGQALISNLDIETSYYIEAITGTYTGKTNPFYVKEREPLNLTIPLEIGEGTYNLNIKDSTGQDISTNIRVFDSSSNKEIEHKTTTSDNSGNTLIRVRADKSVYFVIDNYDSKFITKSYNVQANNTLVEEIILPKVSNNSNIELVGFFDNQGNSVASVSAGQTIKAKFILNVGSNYSRVQAHIRSGTGLECNNVSSIVEQDYLYIKSVEYAGNKVVGSTSFTPCLGEAKDLASITKRDAKWFNVIIDNPINGSYLIEADVVINDSAVGNLPLYYRSEFQKGNSILRYPIDKELGTNVSNNNKQSLYAYAKEEIIFTGASNFCNSELCYSFSVLDKSSKITKNIIDKYSAKENTNYDLSFKFSFEKALQNVSLSFDVPGSTIKINNYLITNAGSQNLDGVNPDNVELGNLSVGDHVSGKINLDVVSDSSDLIIVNVLSNNEIIFSKNINFEVKASKNLNVELMPSVFVPFIANDSIVAISDDANNAIDQVNVSVLVNNKIITSGQSGKSGLYVFTLPSTNLGDEVVIKANKQGYKSVTINREITNNLLSLTPEEIELNIDISKEYSDYQNLVLRNNTIIPLAITKVSTTTNENYIDLKTSNTNDLLINPNESVSLELTASLTQEAFDLMTQKVFEGDVLVTLEDSTLNKSWVIKIPLTIRITFGNSVDYIDCLEINPLTYDIRVDSQEEHTYVINVKNNCTSDNAPVSLGKVIAELDWENKTQLGDFYIKVDDTYEKLKIGDDLVVFNNLDSQEEEKLNLKFISYKLKSGMASPIIKLSTTRANNNGLDKIKSEFTNNVVVSSYTSCISYPKSVIPVMFCALTANYSSLYQGNFGYNPYSYNPTMYGNVYNQQATGNPAYNSAFYQNPYPNPAFTQTMNYQNYLDPDTTNSSNNNMSNMFGCPQSRVPIKNNCVEDMIVSLDSDYGVTVDEDEQVIEKGKTEYFKLQGGSQRGLFRLGVNVKPDADIVNDYTYIGDIQAQVQVATNQIPEGCIEVPKTSFDFSKIFGGGPQKLEVINNCWDQGWYLENVKIKDLKALSYNNIDYFVFNNETSEELASINKNYRKVNGKTIETWTFLIQRNPEIEEINLKIRDSSNPAKLITDLRLGDLALGTVVTLNPALEISYSSPTMKLGKSDVFIKLKDIFGVFGLSGEVDGEDVTLGKKDKKDSQEDTSEKDGDESSKTVFEKIIVEKAKDNVKADITVDKYTGYNPLFITNDGTCVDPKAQNLKGFTGTHNYEKYGFNRILLNWNASELDIDTCEFGNYYCDQTQLYIVANKKIAELENNNSLELSVTNSEKINFARIKVSENNFKVKELVQIKKPVVDLTKKTLDIANAQDIDGYLEGIKTVLELVPKDLRKFAIIDFEMDSKLYNLVTSNNGVLNGSFKNIKYNEASVNHYQINVNYFIEETLSVIESKKPSIFNDGNFCKFIKQIYDTMEMYYGVGLDKSIINLMAYEDLQSQKNKYIANGMGKFSSNDLLYVIVNNIIGETNEPGQYILDIKESSDNSLKSYIDLNLTKTNLKDFNGSYKENVLFYKPFDAYYYNYDDGSYKVPFINEGADSRTSNTTDKVKILSDYIKNDGVLSLFSASVHDDFVDMQKGYILDIQKSNDKYNITYADIRPLQILTVGKSFTYNLLSGEDSLLNKEDPHKWFIKNYSVGKYLEESKTQLVKTTDNTNQVLRTTYFIRDNKDDQVVLVSPKQNNFSFNIKLNNESVVDSGVNTKYYFPKDITLENINADTYKNINNLIKGIHNNDICFEVTKDSLQLWTEPYKAGLNMFVADNNKE